MEIISKCIKPKNLKYRIKARERTAWKGLLGELKRNVKEKGRGLEVGIDVLNMYMMIEGVGDHVLNIEEDLSRHLVHHQEVHQGHLTLHHQSQPEVVNQVAEVDLN